MPNHPEKREAAQAAWQAVVQSRLSNLSHGAPGDRKLMGELADIEIDAMRGSFARALELRNAAASPACWLPPETLANVFAYLQAIWPMKLELDKKLAMKEEYGPNENPFYFTKAWYSVAHVCRVWRQAAHSPSLWRSIACMDVPPGFLPIVMTHTRGLPLTLSTRSLPLGDNPTKELRFYWHARQIISLQDWLTPALLRRVERFTFEDGFRFKDFMEYCAYVKHPMPALQELTVSVAQHKEPAHLMLARQMFGSNQYPVTLRHFSLSNCGLEAAASRAFLTSSITHLKIASYPGNSHKYHDLYPSLACMEHLEEITLENAFPDDDAYTGSPDSLRLPSCLKEIRLSAEYHELYPDVLDNCLRLLGHLIIPPTAYAHVRLRDKDEGIGSEDDDDDDPVETIDDALLDLVLASFLAVEVTTDAHSTRVLNISPRAYSIYTVNTQPFIRPSPIVRACPEGRELGFDCLCRHCPRAGLLDHIVQSPLSMPEYLSFDLASWSIVDSRDWWNDLLPATNVRGISLDWSSEYCEQLWLTMSVPMPTSDVFFPALETIVIYGDDKRHKLNLPDFSFSRAAAALIDMVYTRKERQVPVRDIFVEDQLKHWSIWSLVAEVTPVKFFTPAPVE